MSEIITNKLTGKTAAGDVTITSEGGAATMQLQQGLVKCWVNYNGGGSFGSRDTFNVSSLDDNGTGNHDVNFTNNMNNDDYALAGAAYGRVVGMADDQFYTTYAQLRTFHTDGSASEAGTMSAMFTGDLA